MALPDDAPTVLCIPARDEAAMLPGLLAAIAGQSVPLTTLRVCIYLDDCRDGSADLLDRIGPDLPFRLSVARGPGASAPNAGAARRAALALGLALLDGGEGMVFTTDADSRPHRDWIAAGRKALAVADMVAGRILRIDAAADPLQGRIEAYYDRLHRYRRIVDPVAWEARDTHHFSGGANIALRASAYRDVGGFLPLPCGEDARLLDDAARAGLRVRRDGAMRVETSSRRQGRIAGGLAGQLRALDEGATPMMADPRGAAWQWRAQAAARRAFMGIDRVDVRVALGQRLGLTADHVLGVARDCPNAEAFAMRVVPAPRDHAGPVTLAEAEDGVSILEREWCEIAA
ncbi:MAG: glycosyltransferase [Sphingomonas pseudosanguinis]|uniref:glycosyltransferase n=1 Tax=Sphingomonas pseudosanguinis TaxID=413712 RepID=UPI00391C7D67